MNVKRFAAYSFRQKFFLSYFALLVVFLALMFPFVSSSVQKIVLGSMKGRADELVTGLLKAKNQDELIQIIKDQKHYTFFRIALLDSQQQLLYDSHTKRMLRPLFFPFHTIHPEVEQALISGSGYAEEYSEILGQKLIYLAESFEVNNQKFVLRVAFPYKYTQNLKENFELGFIFFSSTLLILFGIMAGFMLHRMTKPIGQIIDTINTNKALELPKIVLDTHPEDDFSKLANTLNSLSEQIQSQLSMHYKIIEMKKDFIANASHELKTPITIIRGFAETLQDNPDLPQTTTVEITEKIVLSCERMTRIIRNLLTLADIENLPLTKIAPCDLVELARQCRATIMAVHKKAEVELLYDESSDFVVSGDEALLEVAVMNLLDNAAKYAQDQPKITITIDSTPDFITLSVQDNGLGIPESDLERIFQRFYRVNKTHTKKIGGSGLGLSIVQTILEKHQGQVTVTSTLGLGSTFSLHLAKK
ncbi:MAG: HAMP domain-containing histidine kinase [Chlamydiales bacterium]|nr:HAMP domain-containing histidine kinase [Chlamydiales bacterium]